MADTSDMGGGVLVVVGNYWLPGVKSIKSFSNHIRRNIDILGS
ncbi:MAG: hypothetical protein ACKVIF_04855 [Rhodospirillales bacterium]